MNNEQCDIDKLETYLRGELDDAACAEVEAHALKCGPCGAAIESGTKRVAAALKQTYPLINPPAAVADQVMALARPRRRWRAWALALAPAAAALFLAWAFWPKAADVVPESAIALTSADGVVLADGERIAVGDPLPEGASILCVGRAAFSFGGVRIQTDAAFSDFILAREGGSWQIDQGPGAAVYAGTKAGQTYAVLVPDGTLRPLGTRFRVQVNQDGSASLEVYEEKVEFLGMQGTDVIPAGFSTDFHATLNQLNEKQWTAILQHDYVITPNPDGPMAVEEPVSNRIPLPKRAVEQIASHLRAAHQSPDDPMPYVNVALVFDSLVEREAAAVAIGRALERGPDLRLVSDENLWKLARGQALFDGDEGTALRLFELLDQRDSLEPEYRDAWQVLTPLLRLVPVATDEKRAEVWPIAKGAAVTIRSYGYPEDRLPLGEAFAIILANYGVEGRHKPTFEEARELLEDFIANPPSSATDQEMATAHHRLGEALWWTEQWDKSLEKLEAATDFWPVPRWKVHFVERSVGHGRRDRRRLLTLLKQGLQGDPSVYTYRKALGVTATLAKTPEDWEGVKQMAEWVVDTFPSVVIALTAAAHTFVRASDDARAYEVMEQASALLRPDERFADPKDRLLWAKMLWEGGREFEAVAALKHEDGQPDPGELAELHSRVGR